MVLVLTKLALTHLRKTIKVSNGNIYFSKNNPGANTEKHLREVLFWTSHSHTWTIRSWEDDFNKCPIGIQVRRIVHQCLLTTLIYTFCNLGGRWGGRSTPLPRPIYPCKDTRYPLNRKLGGPQDRYGRMENDISSGIQSPNHPACSEFLYRLRYSGPNNNSIHAY